MLISKRSIVIAAVLCFLLQAGIAIAQEQKLDTPPPSSAVAPDAIKAKLSGKTMKGERLSIETGKGQYSYTFSYENCLADAFLPEEVDTGQYINFEWVGRSKSENITTIYFYFDTKYPISNGELALATMYAQPSRYTDIYIADEQNSWQMIYNGLTGGTHGRLAGITIPNNVLSPYIKNKTEVTLLFVIHKKGPYFSGIAKHPTLPFFNAALDISNIPARISALDTDKLLYDVGDDIGVSMTLEGTQASQTSFNAIVKLFDESGKTIKTTEKRVALSGKKKQSFDFKIGSKGLAPGNYAIGADLASEGKVFFIKKLDAFALMGK